MAPVIPNRHRVKSFATEQAFEAWLSKHHDRETEIWLKVHKKDSGLPSVTCAQALDVALCWGWIDGLKKSFDEASFLQRFTPRKPKSVWSQVNRRHVGCRRLPAQLDGDLGRARANVQDRDVPVPNGEQVRDEGAIDRGVVHRVVVASFFG